MLPHPWSSHRCIHRGPTRDPPPPCPRGRCEAPPYASDRRTRPSRPAVLRHAAASLVFSPVYPSRTHTRPSPALSARALRSAALRIRSEDVSFEARLLEACCRILGLLTGVSIEDPHATLPRLVREGAAKRRLTHQIGGRVLRGPPS